MHWSNTLKNQEKEEETLPTWNQTVTAFEEVESEYETFKVTGEVGLYGRYYYIRKCDSVICFGIYELIITGNLKKNSSSRAKGTNDSSKEQKIERNCLTLKMLFLCMHKTECRKTMSDDISL